MHSVPSIQFPRSPSFKCNYRSLIMRQWLIFNLILHAVTFVDGALRLKKKKKQITPVEPDRRIKLNLHTKSHLQRYAQGVGSRDPEVVANKVKVSRREPASLWRVPWRGGLMTPQLSRWFFKWMSGVWLSEKFKPYKRRHNGEKHRV